MADLGLEETSKLNAEQLKNALAALRQQLGYLEIEKILRPSTEVDRRGNLQAGGASSRYALAMRPKKRARKAPMPDHLRMRHPGTE